jgi:hypothetical protein
MKKLIIILTLLVGIIGCSKSSENKSFEKKIDDKQTVSSISENNVQNQNSNKNYEISLKKRIDDIQKEVQPGLDSGVTADMNNAVSKQEELLEAEMKKVYGLLEAKLSDSEKARLKKEQEDWKKEVEKNAEEATKEAEGGTISGVMGGNTWVSKMEERALELAKRYDQLNNK